MKPPDDNEAAVAGQEREMRGPPFASSLLGLRFDAHARIKDEDQDCSDRIFDDLIEHDQLGPVDMFQSQTAAFDTTAGFASSGLPAFYQSPNTSYYPQSNYYPSTATSYASYTIPNELSPPNSTESSQRLHGSSEEESSPPASNVTDPPPQLLILGIPDEGTRTRVETQIRITLMLVQPLSHDKVRLTTPAGQLLPSIRDHAVKLAQWKHLKLPSYTAIKRKHKKHQKTDVTAEDTLFLECQVLRSQEPREVFICANCSERERKRTQRKKDARIRPNEEIETDGSNTTANGSTADYDRRKILLFNCGEFLDFTEAEVTMPCRIACYCRHHKEKDGFVMSLQLKDHQGNVVASAVSPRIFTTDDHKARARPRPGYSGESSTNVSRDTSFEDLSSLLTDGLQSVGKHAKKPSLASLRSRSSTSLNEDAQSDSTSRGRRSDKPYERRMRNGSLTKPSLFSMTPLDGPSRRNSPDSPTVPLPPDTIINTIVTDPFPPGELSADQSYALAPPSPAYSITTSLNDAFSAPSFNMNTSPTLETYEHSPLGMNLNPSPLMGHVAPEVTKVIPAEGNLSGGYQVTVLGKNFAPDTICHFGSLEAIQTQFFSDTTLICVVPPGMAAGPVPIFVVSGSYPQSLPASSGGQFTYVSTDQSILELALQIVGFRLTGHYDNAKSIAHQIVQSNTDPALMGSDMARAPYTQASQPIGARL